MSSTQIRGTTQIKNGTVTVNKLLMDASLAMATNKITGLGNGTEPQDAVTKAQLDASRAGIDVKESVRVATVANITLSGTQTIDGISLVVGNRVLVKDQTTQNQNGIYVVASGSWSRAEDADTSEEVTSGMFCFVEEGTVNDNTGWVLSTSNPIVLGTTALTFIQFSKAGDITAGNGLVKTGSSIAMRTPGTLTGSSTNKADATDHTHEIDSTISRTSDVNTHINSKTAHGLASAAAANDFLVGSGVGQWVKKTLAEIKTILGLGSAAYTNTNAYEAAGSIATHADIESGVHGLVTPTGDDQFMVSSGAGTWTNMSLSNVKQLLGVDDLESIHRAYKEVPTGAINGSNASFDLTYAPIPGSEHVYLNGILQEGDGEDYTLNELPPLDIIVFETGSIPQTGDRLVVTYDYTS